MDILFQNATIVTMDTAAPMLHGAYLGVSGRHIVHLSDRMPTAKAARVVDCAGKVIMPGLYNCHTHAGMSVFKGYANDLKLEDWLFNHIIPAEGGWTRERLRAAVDIAMAEMIASGTIAFTDMYFFIDIMAQAVCESGMLANLSSGMMDGGPTEYLAALTDATHFLTNNGDGRVRADVHVHGCYTSAPEAWERQARTAQDKKLRMHVHLSETKTEHQGCISNYGMTPAAAFAKHGVFDVPTTAAHGVWVTENDIEILAAKGVTVAHCPISNLKLASGLAPVVSMTQGGVNVAIGTDGCSSNNSHDLFEELKMASILQKYGTGDPTAMPAMDTLKMATVNGAKAQGRGAESGMLRTGMDADLIVVDFHTPANAISHDAAISLAYSTVGRDVCLTMVRGKTLYENGEFFTIDIEKVLRQAQITAKEMIAK
jgi:5-methylthioadenosine/S-adenosylhomocysteine deaminase